MKAAEDRASQGNNLVNLQTTVLLSVSCPKHIFGTERLQAWKGL